jgi:signal transduction histidine kinase
VNDTYLIPLFFFGTFLISGFAIITIVTVIILKQKQIKNRLIQQELKHDFSEALLRTKLEVQETTLKTISQELHDNINQILTYAVYELNAAHEIAGDSALGTSISTSKDTVRSAINSIRLLSQSLNTGLVAQRDFSEAISVELRRIESFSAIQCRLRTDEEREPNPEQKLLLFRVAQEGLQNILKHANATEVDVQLTSSEERYELSIVDNGVGFDMQQQQDVSLGMQNMQERIKLLRGTLNVQSEIGKGTSLIASIPLN